MKGWFDLNNKILVADDEKEIRDLLEIYLLNEGYKVVKAKDGQEALDIIENEDVDLLVLDIMIYTYFFILFLLIIRKVSTYRSY